MLLTAVTQAPTTLLGLRSRIATNLRDNRFGDHAGGTFSTRTRFCMPARIPAVAARRMPSASRAEVSIRVDYRPAICGADWGNETTESMAEEKNPKGDPEELTPEQLEQAAGGFSWGSSNTSIKAQDKSIRPAWWDSAQVHTSE